MAQDKSPAGEVDGRPEVADPTVEEATGTVMSGTGTGWSTTSLAAEGLVVLGVAVVVVAAAAVGSGRDPTWQAVVVVAVASCTAGAVCTNPWPFLDSVIALLISCFVIYVRSYGLVGVERGFGQLGNSMEDEEEQRRQQAEEAFSFHGGIYFWAKIKKPIPITI